MSVTIAWPDAKAGKTVGLTLTVSDKEEEGKNYWIPEPSYMGMRTTMTERTPDTTENTFVMDDAELGKLLLAYARRKGIIK